MKSRFILFILGFIIWILITFSLDLDNVITGILVSLLVAFLTGDLFTCRPYAFKHIKRYLWFLYYIPMFVWECFKANVDVAYRVLHPKLPVRPGIVRVKTTLKSDTALTFLANSITLTPGTLTVDIDKDKGILYVHWIYIRSKNIEEATKRVVYRFERILKKVFD